MSSFCPIGFPPLIFPFFWEALTSSDGDRINRPAMNEPFFCLKAISSQLSGSAAIDSNEWNRYGCGKPFLETRLNVVNGVTETTIESTE